MDSVRQWPVVAFTPKVHKITTPLACSACRSKADLVCPAYGGTSMDERDASGFRENDRQMTGTATMPSMSVAKPPGRRTRVKLKRINSDFSKPYPPEGEQRRWWDRLKAALGTTSSDFVNATLVQIQNASRLPSGGISEMSVNSVQAFVEAAEPKNEVEAALAIQMA
jgi:hypothetical protein